MTSPHLPAPSTTGKGIDLHPMTAALDRVTARRARHGLPAPTVLVVAPGHRLAYGDLERRFHCASIDKVMTATLIGRLVEAGRLRFDAPLGTVLPADDLVGLPAADGVDIAAVVTVEHLLTHTSGLPDYFVPTRGQRSSASLPELVAAPDRRWTRQEILDEVRTLRPVGRPGERFRYSDTAYILLGRIAEETSGDAYPALLEREVLERSGMPRSIVPFDDDVTADRLEELDLAPLIVGGVDMSRKPSMVAGGWGGVVTVADDLVRFQEALHGGELVRPETLEFMTRPRNRMRAGIHYGAGAVTLRFGELMPILLRGLPEPVGGLGLTAAHMFYYPQQRAHVVLNFHSTHAMNASFQTHIQIARLLRGGSR